MAREYKEICDRCMKENMPDVQPSNWLESLTTKKHAYDLCPECATLAAGLKAKHEVERGDLRSRHDRELEKFMIELAVEAKFDEGGKQ